MWEVLTRRPRGRISLRNLTVLVTSVMMAVFLVSTVLTTPAFAADAERNGDSVTYNNAQYTKINLSASPSQLPSGLPANTDGYVYFDTAGKKAYFLLTQGPAASATTAQYVNYDMGSAGSYSRPSPVVSITIANAPPDAVSAATQTKQTTTCDSSQTGGIGWILCPVVNFLAKGMDYIYKIVSDFLVVRTITADTNSSIYRMWAIVRDIANLCFVIAFLVILYSQITGVGYSNYNLKKMLPRLIIGAILVNLSFWVTALAVEISNVLGYSIHDIFNTVLTNLNTSAGYESVTVPSWEMLSTLILSGGTIVGVGAFFIAANTLTGALFLLIPVLVGVLLSALVALIVLAARQALIVCLIIISPLAFAAILLPNTEKYFDKWRGLFITLLLLFPIFSVVFSGAQLAGMAIIQSAGGNIVTVILGMAVQVAPIVVTPLLVKFSGGLIGRIAGMVNNPNKGLLDRTRNWSKGHAAERRDKVLSGQNRYFRRNPIHRATRRIDTSRRKREGYRKAYQGLAEARFEGTEHGHNIAALNKHASNEKKSHENDFADSQRGRALELRSRNLSVDQKNIETSMLGSAAGQRLRTRERDAETVRTESDATYAQTSAGRQAEMRARSAERNKQIAGAQHDIEWNQLNLRNPTEEFRLRGLKGDVEVSATEIDNTFNSSSIGHRLDRAKREVERTKQTIHAEHERAWHFRNQTDAGSQERELRLRIATDGSAVQKSKVDAVYAEVKKGETSTLSSSMSAAIKTSLASDAYSVAEQASLTTMRSAQAASELKSKINNELLTNAITYQIDPATGNKVLDASGKPIVISQRTIDSKSLQEYAAGIGKQGNILASAIAEDRADWGKQSQAAGELIAHFKLDSNKVQDLARSGAGTKVRAVDDHGNEYEFDAGDEFVKEAAISKQFKEGSYGQKMQILMETGEKVHDVDASGNPIVRKGHNFAHRSTAKSDAVASGIARLAPFINDVTYNEILKGNFNGMDSMNMHAMRQIFEGRIKADNLAGASNEALDIITRIGQLKNSADLGDQAEFTRYRDQMFNLFGDMYGVGSTKYTDLVSSFDAKFDANYAETIDTYQQILNNSNLSRETTLSSRQSMESALSTAGYSFNPKNKKWER
ncbi:MAG: hypothetical protein KA604_01495 [Candidatus Saccharimonas sp.]|nr:hypothetical protein [Candidatus Saccharimonas sp.]